MSNSSFHKNHRVVVANIATTTNYDAYQYVHNNPVNFTDPAGMYAFAKHMAGGLKWAARSVDHGARWFLSGGTYKSPKGRSDLEKFNQWYYGKPLDFYKAFFKNPGQALAKSTLGRAITRNRKAIYTGLAIVAAAVTCFFACPYLFGVMMAGTLASPFAGAALGGLVGTVAGGIYGGLQGVALNGRWWNAETSADYGIKGAIAGATAGAAVGTVLAVGNAIKWATNNGPGLWDVFKKNFWEEKLLAEITYGQVADGLSLTNALMKGDVQSLYASSMGLVFGFPGGFAYLILKGLARNLSLEAASIPAPMM